MDTLSTGSPYERVVLMKSAQAGGTECGLNWLAYIVGHAPGLALLVMPSLDMARRNTRTRLDPMIESMPVLRERISAPRSRDAYNTSFTKSFPGGMLVMTGANICRGVELDAVPISVPRRSRRFPGRRRQRGRPGRRWRLRGRRRFVAGAASSWRSTPTVAGVSRIEKAYLEGDHAPL